MSKILPIAQKLLDNLLELMPTIYQKDSLQSIIGMFLEGSGHSLPHYCQTKSESAISRFLNHYKWPTRKLIRTVREAIIQILFSQYRKGKKPILQVMLDLTTLEKVGKFPLLDNLVRVYNKEKGLHIVVIYLVVGNLRFPWSFRVYRGKNNPSPSQLGKKLLHTLPSILTKNFTIYVLGDTAFGTVELLNYIHSRNFQIQMIVGVPKSRTLKDGRKVSEIKNKGQQIYLNSLDFPVHLSWVWLERDGKRIKRFVISTKPMKGNTITHWGKRRWQIEAFFKTVKHRFSLHRFGQKTLLGIYRWLILSFISYLLAYWIYLHLENNDNLDWLNSAQTALILLLPHILFRSLFKKLITLIPWLNQHGFDLCLIRCRS